MQWNILLDSYLFLFFIFAVMRLNPWHYLYKASYQSLSYILSTKFILKI